MGEGGTAYNTNKIGKWECKKKLIRKPNNIVFICSLLESRVDFAAHGKKMIAINKPGGIWSYTVDKGWQHLPRQLTEHIPGVSCVSYINSSGTVGLSRHASTPPPPHHTNQTLTIHHNQPRPRCVALSFLWSITITSPSVNIKLFSVDRTTARIIAFDRLWLALLRWRRCQTILSYEKTDSNNR